MDKKQPLYSVAPVDRMEPLMTPTVFSTVRHFAAAAKENRRRYPLWTGSPEAWLDTEEPLMAMAAWMRSGALSEPLYPLDEDGNPATCGGIVLEYLQATSWSESGDKYVPGRFEFTPGGLATTLQEGLEDRFDRWLTKTQAREFLDYYRHAAVSRGQRDTEIDVTGAQLAVSFCTDLGLLVDRSKGRRLPLSLETLRSLRVEAERIVRAFRGWKATRAQTDIVRELIETDPNSPTIDLERIRRPTTGETMLRLNARRFAFAFLLPDELKLLETTKETPKALSYTLIVMRLPEDVTADHLRNVL